MPSGTTIGLTWVTVPAPAGGGTINPDFQSAQTLNVDPNFETFIVYRTDFQGLAVPANFSQHLVAHVDVPGQVAANSHVAAFLRTDSQARSYARTFAPDTLHHDANAVAVGQGLGAFRAVKAMTAPWDDDDDDGGDTGNKPFVVVGSHSTTPVHS
jgi:hypothetical protein